MVQEEHKYDIVNGSIRAYYGDGLRGIFLQPKVYLLAPGEATRQYGIW